MKRFLSILFLSFLLSSCEEHTETPLPSETATTTLTFSQDLNQHFIVESLPNHLSDFLTNLEGWEYPDGAIIYPLLPKTENLSGFLSSEYGISDNLFLVRQSHAWGGGGHYDILFTLHPETGTLIDRTTIGEESYLTSLKYQTI